MNLIRILRSHCQPIGSFDRIVQLFDQRSQFVLPIFSHLLVARIVVELVRLSGGCHSGFELCSCPFEDDRVLWGGNDVSVLVRILDHVVKLFAVFAVLHVVPLGRSQTAAGSVVNRQSCLTDLELWISQHRHKTLAMQVLRCRKIQQFGARWVKIDKLNE